MTYISTDRANARGRLSGMRRRREHPDPVAAFVARGLAVVPAAAPSSAGPGCSCTRIGCPMPAGHPLSRGWRKEASADPAQLERWRTRIPDANYASPTGETHDVLEVPAAAGARALASLTAAGIPFGPVARNAAGDRYLFFTTARPGEADLDEWWSSDLDARPEETETTGLRWHTRGSYVLIPPARAVGGGVARWVHDPEADLPDPLRILEALADACEA
ncbi:bifunctional DNA primase/polymerase [Actinospica sp. MGRD01-02]|uniref:Bifunctional DNA primase/polymerase n=1 Tax=Actinospica acidithermotolerans TaxID=2828514 RepID=A0A941EAS1_9ACTN|nr:bifunctional DNA primase/polymerase [Actinospica acidithermotolerans]MBR7829370.1 bifunctional DNA primase/polymerase [Actinospica acidithermotolerans]